MGGILLSQENSVDFMIHGIVKHNFFGNEVWITTTHVSILIVMLTLIALAIAANVVIRRADPDKVPGAFQNAVEMVVEMLDGFISSTLGKRRPTYYNYYGTIFIFILFSNISGLLGIRPPTADYGTTFPLALITFTLVHFNKFRYNKPKDVWIDMCSPLPPWLPIWLPINIISDIAFPISLSLRLFANILSGTIMMALVYGLLKWIAVGWPFALHIYFDLFSGAIQTYVFSMLSLTYIKNKAGERALEHWRDKSLL